LLTAMGNLFQWIGAGRANVTAAHGQVNVNLRQNVRSASRAALPWRQGTLVC
jgi:hypothetical protein